MTYVASNSISRLVESTLTHADEDRLRDICSEVAQWYHKARAGEEYAIQSSTQGLPKFILHKELRDRFPNLWPHSIHQSGTEV